MWYAYASQRDRQQAALLSRAEAAAAMVDQAFDSALAAFAAFKACLERGSRQNARVDRLMSLIGFFEPLQLPRSDDTQHIFAGLVRLQRGPDRAIDDDAVNERRRMPEPGHAIAKPAEGFQVLSRFSLWPMKNERRSLWNDDRERAFLAVAAFGKECDATFEVFFTWVSRSYLLGFEKRRKLLFLFRQGSSGILYLYLDVIGLLRSLQFSEVLTRFANLGLGISDQRHVVYGDENRMHLPSPEPFIHVDIDIEVWSGLHAFEPMQCFKPTHDQASSFARRSALDAAATRRASDHCTESQHSVQ